MILMMIMMKIIIKMLIWLWRQKSNGDDRLAVITSPFLLSYRDDGYFDVVDLVVNHMIMKTILRSANQNTAVQGLIGSTNAYIGLSDTATEVDDDEDDDGDDDDGDDDDVQFDLHDH